MTDVRDSDGLDARWCAVEDALALGEAPEHAPPPADPRWASAWEREQAFYAALALEAAGHPAASAPRPAYGANGQLAAAPRPAYGATGQLVPSADDLALVDAVLARHEAAGPAAASGEPVVVPLRRSSTTGWVALTLALAAAVVLVFALRPELALRGSEGSWVAEGGQRRGPGDELPMAIWLVADGPACAALDDATTVCAGQGTVLRLHPGEDGPARVEVRRGTVTVDGVLEIETPEGELQGDDGSRFAVTIAGDGGPVEVEVERGALQLVAPEGKRSLEAGERVRLGAEAAEPPLEPAPPTPAPAEPTRPAVDEAAPAPAPEQPARPSERASKPSSDPGALLVQARARLGEGDERGAAKAYAALIEAHPGSAEAQAARVSLGQLRLAGGRAKPALALFDRYLQRGGPLAEEALWGKIQALAALGREQELAAAVERLVREQPRSVYRARAQALLRR